MEKLPDDIMVNIFSRVPHESVYACSLVSKSWNSLATSRLSKVNPSLHTKTTTYISLNMLPNQTFEMLLLKYDESNRRSPLKISRINHAPIKRVHYTDTMYGEAPNRKTKSVIIGSSNGLICMSVPQDGLHGNVNDPLYICNPITGEYMYLPLPTVRAKGRNVLGFGYTEKTNEYKVVRIYYKSQKQTERGHVYVYTLGAGTGWRKKGQINYCLQTNNSLSPGTNTDEGDIYWLYQEKLQLGPAHPHMKEGRIVGFDLANEEFKMLSRPPYFTTLCCGRIITSFLYHKIHVLGGHLFEIHEYMNEFGFDTLNIWSFMKTIGGPMSFGDDEGSGYWGLGGRVFLRGQLPGSQNLDFFDLKENGEVLCWLHKRIPVSYEARKFDPENGTVKELLKNGVGGLEVFETIRHKNSFVSLKALKEEGVKMFDRIN